MTTTRYHIRRADRALTDPEALAEILRSGKYTTIAMVQDGEPYIVTLSYGWDEERNALYFHAATAGRKLDAIAADPRVCATVIADGGYEMGACKHHYRSVVMTGTMAVVTDPDEKLHGMRVLLAHLEEHPEPVWQRNKLDGDAVYGRMNVVRLDIEDVTGKAGS